MQVVTKNVGRFWDWLGGLFSSEPEPAGPPFAPLPPLPEPAPQEAPKAAPTEPPGG